MKCSFYMVLLLCFLFIKCEIKSQKIEKEAKIVKPVKKNKKVKSLKTKVDFENLINNIEFVNKVSEKQTYPYAKWFYNNELQILNEFDLHETIFPTKNNNIRKNIRDSISMNSLIYEYKKDVTFFIHNFTYHNKTIIDDFKKKNQKIIGNEKSIKSILEQHQGKRTKMYAQEHTLIFAMKSNNSVNFIDIPANSNFIELRNELTDKIYSKLNCDAILCERAYKCKYKDFSKK